MVLWNNHFVQGGRGRGFLKEGGFYVPLKKSAFCGSVDMHKYENWKRIVCFSINTKKREKVDCG